MSTQDFKANSAASVSVSTSAAASGSSLSGYGVPAGMGAIMIASLQDMMKYSLELQQLATELEQEQLKALPTIVMACAQATIDGGKEAHDADMAQATGAIISGSVAAGSLVGSMGVEAYASNVTAKGPQAELDRATSYRDELQAPPKPKLVLKQDNELEEPLSVQAKAAHNAKVQDQMDNFENGIGIDKFRASKLDAQGNSVPDAEQQKVNNDAVEQLKVQRSEDAVKEGAYKTALKKAQEQVERCQTRLNAVSGEADKTISKIKMASDAGNSAGQATGSWLRAPHDAAKAQDDANAQVVQSARDGLSGSIEKLAQKANSSQEDANRAAQAIAQAIQSSTHV